MRRKISEKGQESQAGSILGEEMIFPRSEAGGSLAPGSPTELSLTRAKDKTQ